ncbi:oxidoreductase [Chromobacterium sp. IIBBL 290-4]|uniref:oxidoreductase n=1 Tax=Chromobacterium sp. IIBBL 290-4 TaxID=2953890 RepID=UPI0020B73AEF|nr:oxidoreductase [Chromobacterium sp. IIBBL 290-4]UTH72580.1 oxidoreductase [Chromobacterium sp. IIBBL 290-4]
MTERLRVGLGYGYVGATFHAPLIDAVPGLELFAIVTSKPEQVMRDWPQARALSSPDALFACDDIDLVVIATPNDSHFPLARAALAAGKHVVVDKPFTLTLAEADQLVMEADRAELCLSVFHNRRWDADFLTIKQLLDEGRLGRVVHFESHFERFRPEVAARWRETAGPGAGRWYDLGPHLLDQAVQLFGLPEAILLETGALRDGALSDDWFHALLRYPDKRVILHGSMLAAAPAPRFIIHGTEGSFTKFGLDPQEEALKTGSKPGSSAWGLDPQPGRLLTAADGEQPYEGAAGDYRQYYAAIRDCILEGKDNPVPPQAGACPNFCVNGVWVTPVECVPRTEW